MTSRNTSRFRQIPSVLTLALLAGCGVDREDAQAKVERVAEQTMKADVTEVRCPRAERKKGVTFECAVTFAEGGTHAMRVTLIDNHGNADIRWSKAILSMTRLGESIAEITRVETGREIAVDCGRGLREITPEGFECTIDGTRRIVDVDARDVSWRIRAPAAPALP